MVSKSLILAFSALAAAAPQLGALGGLGGLGGLSSLKPGSKAASADKAAPSGETIPDGLNYNKPLEDDEDEDKDWSNWEYNEEDYIEDPEDPGTVGSTVENKADPNPDNTTVVQQVTSKPYEEFPSTTAHLNISTTSTIFRELTTSTTLRAVKSTSTPIAHYTSSTTLRQVKSSAPAYKQSTTSTTLRQVQSTTARNEIPAYSTPVKQDNEIESYEAPVKNDVVHSTSSAVKANVQTPYQSSTTLRNEVPEPYHSTTVQAAVQEPYHTTSALKNEVAQPYQSTTVQAAVQEPYHSTTVQAAVQEPYHSTTVQAAVQEPYHSTTVQAAVQELYHSTTVQAAVQEPYHTTTVQANVQEPYHSTTLKNEAAQPYSTSVQANVQSAYRRDLEGYGKAEFEKQSHLPTTPAPACAIKPSAVAQPAVVSSAPLFGQAVESHVSGLPVAADKQSSSSIWSAVPYSTPAVTHDAPKQQQTSASSASLAAFGSSTPLADAVVPANPVILVNNLRPVNTTTESMAKDIASPAESTVKLEKVASTTVSIATAPASKLLQTFYPTTTGAANATGGIAAATTGAISNNTLPQFEGAAASSSSFIAGSVIALAIAALAL
jgi:hypothetical protein